ncbi:UDP-N-acetylmuramate--L-alanine ligase [Candidatus Palauibacter sp.]|uniref:UDP-N-acetylmuramate--L-alanine ligase n=1 Tax=Candidatus Palauibacter sp. TaxID=3101350 RepID=UPI003B51B120
MTGATVGAPRPAGIADLPAPGAHVHLMGIGGAGMRGLALALDRAGYVVSGCDRAPADALGDLAAQGITVEREHAPSHVSGADLLVRSSAVPEDQPEVVRAGLAGVPVMRRARALGALLNGQALVGIAGTHGKTTITAMAGHAAAAAGLDPLVLVGGRVDRWKGFTRPGDGPAIVEADEFDRSFLELQPTLAVVSSLEPEHLDTYGTWERLRSAFTEFAGRARHAGGLIYCHDDEGARGLAEAAGFAGTRHGFGYGFGNGAWCRLEGTGPRALRLSWPDGEIDLTLRVPGRHNRLNAAAAFLATVRLGGDPRAAARGLAGFRGVARRLEMIAAWPDLTVFDDYAHHPTEVAASLAALREAYPEARLRVVFQPHLFTRTRDFAGAFARALALADDALVLPIYPAREAPLPGVTSDLIAGGSGASGAAAVLIEREDARCLVPPEVGAGEAVLVFMGAGDVTDLAHAAVQRRAGDAVGT